MKDTFDYINKYATFNPERTRRFVLHRRWDIERPCAMVIGLNPSNADEHEDDPTIGFVVRVLSHNGYGGLYMVNLFTMITPYPEQLVRDDHELSAENIWCTTSNFCYDVVFAWGNFKTLGRNERAKAIFKNAFCFRHLKNGEPRHGMYLPANTVLKKYLNF